MKFDDLKKKAAELAQTGATKSRQLAAIAKLKAANLGEEDAIRKAYIELGKQYFAMYGQHPEDEFVAACTIIKEAQATIAANNDMIKDIKERAENGAADEIVIDDVDIHDMDEDDDEDDSATETPADESDEDDTKE